MPNPKPTFEKIYIEMYCKNCEHWRYSVLRKEICMLPVGIQNACMSDYMDLNVEGPGYMYHKKEG